LLFISQKNTNKYYHNKRDKFLNKFFFTKKFFTHKKIITINDKTYDLSKNKKISKKYIVYVDTPLHKISKIPDKDLPNEKNKSEFYKLLNIHLNKLSKNYKKKVVICLHPKTNYQDVKKYFNKYICKKFKTFDYMHKAFLIVCIASTSVAYGIYNKKKILIVNSKNLKNFIQHSSEMLATNYNLKSINLDDTKINNLNINNINTKIPYKILKKNVVYDQKISGDLKIINTIKKI